MKNAIRTRQRLFTLVLPLTGALYGGAEGLDPKGQAGRHGAVHY